jgi:hypothetical protein
MINKVGAGVSSRRDCLNTAPIQCSTQAIMVASSLGDIQRIYTQGATQQSYTVHSIRFPAISETTLRRLDDSQPAACVHLPRTGLKYSVPVAFLPSHTEDVLAF